MLAWKLCTLAAATALLATAAARAEDGAATVIVNSAQVAVADSAGTATITGSGTVTLSGVSVNGDKGDKGMTLTFGTADDAGPVVAMKSDYWLGVIASPPGPALQSQLNLPKDQGLVVEALEPEGPAAKAGVKQFDILLKGNDKPLTGLHDLFQLMNEVKDGTLKLDLLRAGKHDSVTVTPAKRPAHANAQFGMVQAQAVEGQPGSIQLFSGANTTEGTPIRFRVIGPGEILPPGSPPTGAAGAAKPWNVLSDGSKVEITQKGSEPLKVVVTRDKEKWEGTSKDLSKIPEKIRPEIEKLLHPAFGIDVFAVSQGMPGAAGPVFGARGIGMPISPVAVSSDVEKLLGEMQKQIDELRRTVEVLQGKDKKAEPKPE